MKLYRRPTIWVLGCLLLVAACSSDGGRAVTTPTSPGGDDLVALVASYDLVAGPASRVIVGVQSADRLLVAFGTVTMRFAYLGTKEAPIAAPVQGPPVSATYLPIHGTPASPDGASTPQLVTGSRGRGVYAAPYGFDRPGFWQVEVTAPLDGGPRKGTGAFEIRDRHLAPAPGDLAPRSQNLTMDAPADVPRAAIDSRAGRDGTVPIPDPELHATTVAAALDAGRPVVLVVATPEYCTSRFCGPVTDLVRELSREYGDRASFVHIEVYRDFQNNEPNPDAEEWAGGVEPWVFVVGGDGRITARFDNVTTRAELEPILQALPVITPPA